MTNIPTDLLRTLVAVVDLRSYTKAANSLGVTQPAVSAQIKRLTQLIGADLFERGGQGVALTSRGERVSRVHDVFCRSMTRSWALARLRCAPT
jgi:DNA-binding transcriptional LysR family regulator